jgi:quinol monooxygenase YgiN
MTMTTTTTTYFNDSRQQRWSRTTAGCTKAATTTKWALLLLVLAAASRSTEGFVVQRPLANRQQQQQPQQQHKLSPPSSLMSTSAPNSFCTLIPTFKVNDWDKVNPILDELVEATKKETSVIYYDFVANKETSTVVCREAYVDGDGINKHLENAGPILGKLLDGPAELVSMHVQGPEEEMTKVKAAMDPMGATYSYVYPSGFTNMITTGITEDLPHTFCTIYPTMTVLDMTKVEAELIPTLVEGTKSEKGCVYYGFTLNKEDNLLICREAYVDGAALNIHLGNAVKVLGPAIEGGLIKIESMIITGPEDQLAIAKEAGDALGAVYQETLVGFSRFTV